MNINEIDKFRNDFFDKVIKDGQIPPRWAGNQMLNGYGYPLFIFSYQKHF